MKVPQWPKPQRKRDKPTIAELIEILDSEEEYDIQILPNGEIRSKNTGRQKKPITMRENLGGEYAVPR